MIAYRLSLAILGGLIAATTPAPAALAQAAPAAAFASDRIGVTVEGQGPEVILIPGLTSSPEIWDETARHLVASGKRVHRVHVSGFDGRPAGANASGLVSAPVADEIARYVREQGLQRPAVIGHSMGGTIGLMLAARHPQAVDRIMVVDMLPFLGSVFGGPTATPESVAPIAEQTRARMAGANDAGWVAATRAQMDSTIADPADREGPVRHAARSDRDVAGRAMAELITTDLRPELSRVRAPVTVLYVPLKNVPGMTDALLDQAYRGAYANLSGARLKRINDSGHFIMFDQTEAFLTEVDAFLSAD
ncbi:alpha/beta hydrolase [Brevundimonas sp. 2R-24]|uniref:Alpha/beta hydrolase n=1 Tax=Peiella sedimenti TaxID=3061083 RepID=A0ABT8SJY6_9CAUL|nr:alpha/beta hydrolase [Caulobacteraceae bacterium XZ-24]